jgi:hypothetical protein
MPAPTGLHVDMSDCVAALKAEIERLRAENVRTFNLVLNLPDHGQAGMSQDGTIYWMVWNYSTAVAYEIERLRGANTTMRHRGEELAKLLELRPLTETGKMVIAEFREAAGDEDEENGRRRKCQG